MEARENQAKILIVDDEKINIDILVGLLKPYYRTTAAKSGEQALKRLENPPLPDLILLDIMMPGMDGYEVCRKIKENPAARHIPIIFITGRTDEQDEAMGFKAGAVDYVTKPFSSLIVLARVNTHIELKRRGDMLERLVGLDGLTGIPNRRHFDRSLASEWKRSQRHRHDLSLLLIDIDCFKLFNDHYGHTVGDECLRKVAKAISRSVPRAEDLAARYGGEEFACILPETGQAGSVAVAERILENVRALKITHSRSTVADHITVSIGIAAGSPASIDRPIDLVDVADRALYEAKRRGRNQVACLNNR